MKTIEKFKTQANSSGLSLMGVTSSNNGYPEPDLGYFAKGFNSFKDAEEFAKENGGTIIKCTWMELREVSWRYE